MMSFRSTLLTPCSKQERKKTSFQNVSGTRASVAHWLTPCSKQGKGKTASFQQVPGTRASVAHWLTTRSKPGAQETFRYLSYARLLYITWRSALFILLCVCFAFFLVLSHVCQSTLVFVSISPLGAGREALEMVFHASFADSPVRCVERLVSRGSYDCSGKPANSKTILRSILWQRSQLDLSLLPDVFPRVRNIYEFRACLIPKLPFHFQPRHVRGMALVSGNAIGYPVDDARSRDRLIFFQSA